MTYKITFEENPAYVHATITGTNSPETVRRYVDDIKQECIRLECFRVLAEERLEGPRFDAMKVFAIVSEVSMKALGQFEAIAYVDQKMGEMDEIAEFGETIAVNRGMPIAVFDNVDSAKDWLSRQEPGASGQAIFFNREKPAEKN